MSYIDVNSGQVIAQADGSTRQLFIKKTYLHLAAAIALFALVETVMIQAGLGNAALKLLSVSQWAWLGVLVVYGIASNLIHRWALTAFSIEKQYAAWFAGIVIEAVIFLPMIALATMYSADLLQHAAVVTMALVVGLTAIVFTTGKDFSFLRPALTIGFFIALGVIVASLIFGFSLGLFFSGAMIVFAAGAILYETSQIQHHYHESQYVGASLSLFSSVGLLFWYVLQFLMAFAGND
ncbi:MAG: permease [Gammaproteobacteria bacterium]|nr:MAG: permease [Gammaproteobacteria bacterium]